MRLAPAILIVSSALTAFAAPAAFAQARIFCCDDGSGRKVCADFLPKECTKRAYEERDEKGFVVGRKEAPLTPEQIARREAEATRKAEEQKKQMEERRRNLALLSTYSTEKDIDVARDKAVVELQKLIVQAEKGLDDAQKAFKKADAEREFYKGKTLPGQVKKQIADADADVKAKQEALAARRGEVDKLKQRFEDEKKKFRELKGVVSPGPATVAALPPAPPAAPQPPGQPAGAVPGAPAAPTAPPRHVASSRPGQAGNRSMHSAVTGVAHSPTSASRSAAAG